MLYVQGEKIGDVTVVGEGESEDPKDEVLMFRIQKHGTTLVLPLEFRVSETNPMERLLVEFLSICFLIEDIPSEFDSLDVARETLRRYQSWLVVQDSGKVGYATPHNRQLHPSMQRITELFVMGTKTPWGFQRTPGEFLIIIIKNVISKFR